MGEGRQNVTTVLVFVALLDVSILSKEVVL